MIKYQHLIITRTMKARIQQNGQSMNDMLRKAQQMQQDAEEKQAELDEREYTTSVSNGMVEVTINGKHQIRNLKIDPQIVDPEDVEMLEDLIMSAINKVNDEADKTASEEMEKITSGLNIPGMPGMF